MKGVDHGTTAARQTFAQRGPVQGNGAVFLPDALEREYPNANREWVWQYVFPLAGSRSTLARVPCAATTWMKRAAKKQSARRAASGIVKPVGPHTLRHCLLPIS